VPIARQYRAVPLGQLVECILLFSNVDDFDVDVVSLEPDFHFVATLFLVAVYTPSSARSFDFLVHDVRHQVEPVARLIRVVSPRALVDVRRALPRFVSATADVAAGDAVL